MTAVTRLSGIRDGLGLKAPVRAATTANITLAGEQTIDGVNIVDGDSVLVKDQSDTTGNGVYVASTGNWQRRADFSATTDVVQGTAVNVAQGTTNARTLWQVSTSEPSPGSALSFEQINIAIVSGELSSITDLDISGSFKIGAVTHIQQRGASGTKVTNIGVGFQALNTFSASSSKLGNNAFGYKSFEVTYDAQENTGVGYQSGQYVQGDYNTFMGYKSGNASPSSLVSYKGTVATSSSLPSSGNTTGDGYFVIDTKKVYIWNGSSWVDNGVFSATRNVGVGAEAMRFNSTGGYNVAIGYQAHYSAASASNNTAIGAYSAFSTTTGTSNMFLGTYSGFTNTSGTGNVAVGYSSLYTNSTSHYNVAIGYSALNLTTGTRNVGIGYQAGSGITTGNYNVVFGGYTGAGAPISATGSSYTVFSTGAATIQGYFDGSGNFTTVGTVTVGGNILSDTDNTDDLGSAAVRFANAYVNKIFFGAGTTFITSGSGTPEGAVTAPVGSLFLRTDGGATTTLYVKTSGTGNTGWTAK